MDSKTDLQYRLGPCDDGEYVSAVARAENGAAAARDGQRPMRILWVKVGGLWPIDTGGRLRSFNLIKELSRNHEVSVITTHHPLESHGDLPAQLPHCAKVVSLEHASVKRTSPRFVLSLLRSWFTPLPVDLYKSRIGALEQQVKQTLEAGGFDLCVVDFLFAAPNVPLKGSTPTVFFAHNVEYMIWQRLCHIDTNPIRRAVLGVEWRKMKRYETGVCADAAMTIAVSTEDRDELAHAAKRGTFRAIPTGVDIDYFKANTALAGSPTELVFTGSMDWHPNEDAILYFIETILPLIRREVPEVSFTVAGRNPGAKLLAAAREARVTMTGTVSDVRPYIDKAAVYVVPLRVGGGTRLKIFEALAMGKAVVSTTIGAEGLPLEEGVHVVRADTAETFAAAVVALLRDRAAREDLGRNGRELMEEKFSWPKVTQDFAAHCREVVRQ
jgi:glycosyltransferase involved in cell wall biosynthesis